MEDLVKDMKPKFIKDLGMRYPTANNKYKYRFGLYECQYCGSEFECKSDSVNTGNTKSCGCLRGGNPTHGLRSHRFYPTWYNMTYRCSNPKSKDYKDYGARGITVCEEWLDIRNFTEWCNSTCPKLEGYTLDRINNDKGYSPENCTWSDKTAQVLNRRIMKNNKSGYVGVIWYIRDKRWVVNIRISKKLINIGSFKDKIEAVLARDNYIIENKLPHKLSILNTGFERITNEIYKF